MNITEFRQKFPQYNDMSDNALSDALYTKHYSDMPREEFNKKFGYTPVGTAEDIAKATGPSILRGAVGLATMPSTLTDLAASGVAAGANKLGEKGYISPETAKTVSGGANVVRQKVSPLTYGAVMKDVEEGFPSVGIPGTGPLYKPQTTGGKFVGTGLEFLPGAFVGGGATLAPRIIRALTAGAGSEGAGQLAEKYGPEGSEPWARILGGVGGGMIGPRSTTEATKAASVLKEHGVPLTAGRETGSKTLGAIESLLASNKRLEKEAGQFTGAAAAEAGMPGATKLNQAAFQAGSKYFDDYNNVIKGTTIQPNNFLPMVNEMDAIRAAAAKALGWDHMATIDRHLNDIKMGVMGSKATNPVASMAGDRYQVVRDRLQQAIKDSGIKGERQFLGEMREALTNAMGKELPAELQNTHRQFANFKLLENIKPKNIEKGTLTPETLRDEIAKQWGPQAYHQGRGMAPLAEAGVEAARKPSPSAEKIAAALGSIGGYMAEKATSMPGTPGWTGAILGHMLGPVVQSTGRAMAAPVRGAYFNPMVQALLKKSALPERGTAGNAADLVKLLAAPTGGPVLSRTGSYPEAPMGYPYYTPTGQQR